VIRLREGEAGCVSLAEGDAAYLARKLGGRAAVSASALRVDRIAGIWALPSGLTLTVEPRKGTGADLFAWMCAIDDRLTELDTSAAPAGASKGGLPEVAALTFCHLLTNTLQRVGPRRHYAERRTAQATIRGRIAWSTYAREPLSSRIPCVYWERDVDTPLNRLFSRVVRQLLVDSQLGALLRVRFSALVDLLGGVPPTPPPALLDLKRPLPRTEAAFEPARQLAVVLLERLGLAFTGALPAFTFSLDLARLFERSVERALELVPWRAQPRFQVRHSYDNRDAWSAIDAIVTTERGPVIVETKYASVASKPHLYQVLAYMRMMDSRVGVLIYPSGAEIGSRRLAGPYRSWEVHILELDPVLISRLGRRALADFAATIIAALAS
jgi:5-methylcytosine-specific restriction endonuclease McrBC regulatory subunit McrC